MTNETRLSQVESELADVTARLRRLEGAEEEIPNSPPVEPDFANPPELAPMEPELAEPEPLDQGRAPQVSALPRAPRQETFRSAPRVATPKAALDLEALFGGRVLAWLGGLAIFAGAVLFLVMAVSRGWLDEEARTIIAAAVSLAALVGGVWLHERQGRTEAARGLVAAAISGLFGTIGVATQLYGLVSPAFGLLCAAAVAAAGFAIAVRWRSPLVAALGSLGALAMPMVTGAGISGTGIAFVAIALAATAAILVWQRWDWLALGAFVVSAPQLIGWIDLEGREHLVLAVAVLAGFWLLYAGAAVGYELRKRATEFPAASWILLFGAAATFVAPGYVLLDGAGHHTAAIVLLFGFALLQAALGGLAMRLRLHYELGSLLIAIGIGLGAFALGETFHGPGLVVAWAAAAATLAWLGSLLDVTPGPLPTSAERMTIAAVVLLGLAIGHTLLDEAPPSMLALGVADVAPAVIALGACVASAIAVGWYARRVHRDLGTLLIGIGIALVAFGLGLSLHGATLVAAWAAGAVALAALGSRLEAKSDLSRSDAGLMLFAAGGYLALAIGHTLIVEAPPSALVHGVPDLGAAIIALGACVASAIAVGWFARRVHRDLGTLLIGIGIALVAFGLDLSLHGPALVVAWAAGAVALAALGSRLDATPDLPRSDAGLLLIAAGAYLALAVGHTLIVEAPPSALVHGAPDLGAAAIALGACVASAFVGGLLARRISPDGARIVLFSGVAFAAYGLGATFHGLALVCAWAFGAVILAALGSRLRGVSDVQRVLIAAGGYLALAVGHMLIVEAPPSALVHGVPDLGVAVAAVGACAAAALAGGWSARKVDPRLARIAAFAGAGVLVYLGSVLIVDTIGVTATGQVRQAGQTWLSAFWTVTGLGAVIVGLVRRRAEVRLAGLSLLGIAIGKVWTFDLAELDQLSRVLSFVGLGILLLVGAFAYQRIKPASERIEEPAR